MESQESLEVLGFQMRSPMSSLPMLWPQSRRDEYLLQASIEIPLSADPRVWPLIGGELAERLFVDYSPAPFEAPNGLNVFRLQGDFPATLDTLSGDEGYVVALEVAPAVAKALIQRHAILRGGSESQYQTAAYLALGYDVCDPTLLSGLMNCAVTAAERLRLREKFAPLVNRYGLFDSRPDADAFSAEISQIVPEHAPFFPVQLKRIGSRSR